MPSNIRPVIIQNIVQLSGQVFSQMEMSGITVVLQSAI